MSRLHVGGLALIVGVTKNPNNVGKVVTLKEYRASQKFSDGITYYDLWICTGGDLTWPDGLPLDYGYFESKNLLPLGDDKGVDLFKLKEETAVKELCQ